MGWLTTSAQNLCGPGTDDAIGSNKDQDETKAIPVSRAAARPPVMPGRQRNRPRQHPMHEWRHHDPEYERQHAGRTKSHICRWFSIFGGFVVQRFRLSHPVTMINFLELLGICV